MLEMVIVSMLSIFFFFFSSRRRHTRCSRDWSSDVCSSDLEAWPFWKKRAPDDTKCQARIAALQEPNGRPHSVDVTLGMLKKVSDRGRHRSTLPGGPRALAEHVGRARDERC